MSMDDITEEIPVIDGQLTKTTRRHRYLALAAGAALLLVPAVASAKAGGPSKSAAPAQRALSDSTEDSTDDSTDDSTEDSTEDSTDDSTEDSDDDATIPDGEQTFSGIGGSVTVMVSGGELSLVSFAANDGFEAEINGHGDDDVEVRFESDDHETRIRIRIHDGELREEIREEADDDDSDSTVDDDDDDDEDDDDSGSDDDDDDDDNSGPGGGDDD